VAGLFGLSAAPAAACRVLELGCGDGGNLLSLAQALPGARFLGVDASPGAIARGNELAAAAGLENVELRHGDIERLPERLGGFDSGPVGGQSAVGRGQTAGGFDYVIAHGVYSWIPPAARGALLRCCRRLLNPAGVAYVSYNAYPGSYLRDMTRDILLYHLRGVEDPHDRLARAQELMRTIVAIETPSPHAQALREQLQRMLGFSDALLLHDDLATISTPFYLHEFVEHAAGHGLRFLSEAELADSQIRDVPPSAAALMASLPDDAVVREQYLDFFRNRMFRQTLLCHAEVAVRRQLDEGLLERLAISSSARPVAGEDGGGGGEAVGRSEPDGRGEAVGRGEPAEPQETAESGETFATPEGYSLSTSEPHVAAAMNALARAWPRALDFQTVLDAARRAAGPGVAAEAVATRVRDVLLQAHLARIVQLHSCPPPVVAQPGERPRASPLARAQQAAGRPVVSSLLHANVRLDGDLERRLLGLLDGTRDRAELLAALEGRAASGADPSGEATPGAAAPGATATASELDDALAHLVTVGLLAA